MRTAPPIEPNDVRDYHHPDYFLGSLTTVTLFHDPICPWCWAGWHHARRLTQEFGIVFDWRGAELIPPGMEFNPAPRKPRNPDLPPPPPSRFDLFLESEGIALSSPRPPFVRSHLALLGLEYAWLSSRAKFDIFNEAIYRGFWERHEDISDMAVLMDYATRAGLNPKAFRDSLTSEQYAAHVVPFDDDVYAIGVRHVPSFIFNGEELLAEAPYSSLAGAAERFLIRSEKFKEKIAQK